MVTSLLFLLALVGAGLHVRFSRREHSPQRVAEIMLLWLLVMSVGVNGLVTFISHLFVADWVAAYSGWPQGTPFQGEVGFANLALGMLGVLCLRLRGEFWLATAIAASIFFVGSAIVHVKTAVLVRMIMPGDVAALLPELLLPVLLPALLAVQAGLVRETAEPWRPPAHRT